MKRLPAKKRTHASRENYIFSKKKGQGYGD